MRSATTRVRCPVLVGRQQELTRLMAAVARATFEPSTVGVVGSPGVGKSRLVTELMDAARSRGVRVLLGHCTRSDRTSSLRPLHEAFVALVGDRSLGSAEALAPFVPSIHAVLPLTETAPEQAKVDPVVVGEGLRRVLQHVAGDEGVLLVVEDLHWADSDTVAVLAYLARRLHDSGTAIVVTSRVAEPGAPALLDELLASCNDVVDLQPLPDDAVEEMARACLPDGFDTAGPTLDRLQREAGGLPLLVEDLLAAGDGDQPRRFTDLITARLDALPPSARDVLMVAALAGDDVDVDLLRSAMDTSSAAIAEALHLGSAHLLLVDGGAGLRFRHALTADIVAGLLPPDERSRWANRLAEALRLAGPERLGRAARLWDLAGDRHAASEAYLDAGRDAARHGAVGIAEELCRSAMDNADDTDLRREATIELVGILLVAGRHDDVVAIAARGLDEFGASPATSTHLRLALADAQLHRGDPAAARIQLDAIATRGAFDATVGPRAALLEARYALAVSSTDRVAAAGHLAAQAVGLAERADDPALTCEALELVALCERANDLGAALAPLERCLAVATEHGLALARLRALNEIGAIELLRDAVPDRLLRARDSALEMGVPGTLASIELNLTALHIMRGEIDAATEAAHTVIDLGEPLGLVPLVAAATMLEGVGAGHRGDDAEMERLLKHAERLAPDDPDMLTLAWAAGRGVGALLQERRDDARRAFEHADGYPAPARTLNPARGPLLLLRSVAGEDVNEEIAAARAAVSGDARYPNMWLSFAQAVNHRGDHETDVALSSALLLSEPYRLFRAVALRLTAEAALRDGWGEPAAWLRDAEAEFVARSLPRIASACRGLLRQAGEVPTRRRGDDAEVPAELLKLGVTAREVEVLDLVAERLTNRQIAERLFMSPRTVEKHVASLLRKTGTERRDELVFYARHR